jgi:hypothetical protein
VTFFGLFLTPVFYSVIRRLTQRTRQDADKVQPAATGQEIPSREIPAPG